MAVIDSAYQYYLSTYGNALTSRYDAHKKSQLRAVYNNIVKVNKDAPLYKLRSSGDAQKFAIDLKEKTRSIQNMIASLSDADGGMENVFSKKIAQSSDEELVSAEYIGFPAEDTAPFEMEVQQLAAPQVNQGKFLEPDGYDLKAGVYSFELNTTLNSYEFQYSVREKNTNREIQEKLVRLLNNANVGLRAELVADEKDRTAIQVASRQTGIGENENYIFEILPAPDGDSIRAMKRLGIDNVAQTARNSSFILNGAEHSSCSNTFTVNNAFEITLKKESPVGAAVQIGFKANSDAVADNVQALVNVYNSVIELGHHYEEAQQSNRLLRDMESVAKDYREELESIGLTLNQEGYIVIDRERLGEAVVKNDAQNSFSILNKFKDSLNERAESASINPMNYVDKVVVSYKNPGHNFATPYVISIYSGMMLDCYC